MAINRMFLVHKPSMLGVNIGKRYLDGWYYQDDGLEDSVNRLFDYVKSQYGGEDDDFVVFMESDSGKNLWTYSGEDAPSGLKKFEMVPNNDS